MKKMKNGDEVLVGGKRYRVVDDELVLIKDESQLDRIERKLGELERKVDEQRIITVPVYPYWPSRPWYQPYRYEWTTTSPPPQVTWTTCENTTTAIDVDNSNYTLMQ